MIITNQGDKTLTFDDVDSVDPGKRIMTNNKTSLGQHMCLRLVLCWSMTELKRCCLKVFNSNPSLPWATNSERILSPYFLFNKQHYSVISFSINNLIAL